jgi:hypothetical protein
MPALRKYESPAQRQAAYRLGKAATAPPRDAILAKKAKSLAYDIISGAQHGDAVCRQLLESGVETLLARLIFLFEARAKNPTTPKLDAQAPDTSDSQTISLVDYIDSQK